MAKRKKDRTALLKRRNKARLKQQRRRKEAKIQQAKASPKRGILPMSIVERPGLGNIDAPDGFRAVGVAQSMTEFAEPLMVLAEEKNIDDMNAVFKIASMIWNVPLLEKASYEEIKNITHMIHRVYGLTPLETNDLLNAMVERKNYLFPEEMQPKNSMIMFMRKEMTYLINEFNYNELEGLADRILPTKQDQDLVLSLKRLDQFIDQEAEYSEYESHYFSVQDACVKGFEAWLLKKNIRDTYQTSFPFCLHPYLDFIYSYMHDDKIILKTVSERYIEEFFTDYLLRKVSVEPHEYIEWPPALKLFYEFLYEIGYLENPEQFNQRVTAFEPEYLRILRKRYA